MDIKSKFIFPCLQHLFGTDEIGRDILTRVLYGGRYSLSIGFIAIGSSCIVGSIIGAFCGYYGGMIDNIIMRFLDIFQALPGMLLTITISAALGTGFDKTILALAIGRIPGFARMMRSSIMNVRGNEFIEAAEAIGCGQLRRIFKHAVPNALAPVIVEMTMGIANCVLTLSSLSYIGLGVQPPTPEWGAMLSSAKAYIRSYPYMIIFPGIFIALTVLSLNLAGDGLRDALDPKLKK
jgi:peptide/nickel transport system permease protein